MALAFEHTFSSLARTRYDAESLNRVFECLNRNDLTWPGGSYEAELSRNASNVLSLETRVVGLPYRREEKRNREDLDRIKWHYGASFFYPVLMSHHSCRVARRRSRSSQWWSDHRGLSMSPLSPLLFR